MSALDENTQLLQESSERNRSELSLNQKRNRHGMNCCVISLVVFVITLGLLVSSAPHTGPKRNVIMMVSDGFGPASEVFGREFYQFVHNTTYDVITPLDTILIGQSRTRSSSSLITDSAAGATAFSCAMKSYNGAVGVDPERMPCGTVLEAAKREGFLTGLVATSRVTHATPAAFSAHVPDRDMEAEIASQQLGFYPLGRNVDLMFGGGRCFFEANTTQGSCRQDDRDLIGAGTEKGWSFIYDKQEFDALEPMKESKLPLAGLFAPGHMEYELDRDPQVQPSLKEMAQKALDILEKSSRKSSQGFFLMIEGSRIDMAAHSNDPSAHASDILAYYQTISAVKEFVQTHPETVMISVSDHETGGFTIGRQLNATYPDYVWYPEVISRVKSSSVRIADRIMKYSAAKLSSKVHYIRNTIVKDLLGITDPTDGEIDGLLSENPSTIADTASEMVSFRAQIGWTTHGHTGVDVNLYGYGNQVDRLHGSRENTEIGDFMVEYLGINLAPITKKLTHWQEYLSLLTSTTTSPNSLDAHQYEGHEFHH